VKIRRKINTITAVIRRVRRLHSRHKSYGKSILTTDPSEKKIFVRHRRWAR
jgi:hypothetical protein